MRLMWAAPSLSMVVRSSVGGACARASQNHPAGRVNKDAKDLLVIRHDRDSNQSIRIQDFSSRAILAVSGNAPRASKRPRCSMPASYGGHGCVPLFSEGRFARLHLYGWLVLWWPK
jgi:hypothetical protein